MPRVTIEAEVDIEAECSKCGATLSCSAEFYSNGSITITADPCETCLDTEYDKGYSAGKKATLDK